VLLGAQRSMRLPELWRSSRGRGQRIAVIDTGVAPHRLLAGRLLDGGDYVTGGSGLADCDGHGTAVAGIAAAAPDPATGFAGVAPAAEVLSIRQASPSYLVRGPDGVDRPSGTLDSLARAVRRAVDLGATVINISEVACASPTAPGTGELRAALDGAARHDVVVVAAAGNSGDGRGGRCPERPGSDVVALPGWFDEAVLTVGSLGPAGMASTFSYPGPWVDVAAPGEALMSLAVGGSGVTDRLSGVSTTGPVDGTSFAAPSVAGLAALVRARYPELTARQVVDRITATAARHVGRSDTMGFGGVDPLAALTRAPEVLPPPGTRDRAATGVLALDEPVQAGQPAGPGVFWAGGLGLLAAVTAGVIAVGRLRRSGRPPPGGSTR
jgi:membrane-anchored mycosin MYCP